MKIRNPFRQRLDEGGAIPGRRPDDDSIAVRLTTYSDEAIREMADTTRSDEIRALLDTAIRRPSAESAD